MTSARRRANQKVAPYATGADFCRIFTENLNRLYLLSFLLTGDQSAAEECFVRGLENADKGNPVFKDWAESWARRTIIQNAIQMVRPRLSDRSTKTQSTSSNAGRIATEPAEMAAIVRLPAFERFACVISALEGYSDQETSLLLNCTRGEVSAARARALLEIGKSAEHRRKIVSIGSGEQSPADGAEPELPLGRIPNLAATA